jgi:hypothetical protein
MVHSQRNYNLEDENGLSANHQTSIGGTGAGGIGKIRKSEIEYGELGHDMSQIGVIEAEEQRKRVQGSQGD